MMPPDLSTPTSPFPKGAYVAGTGSYIPERILSNADLEKMVETSNEWIVSRTGMKERRIAAEEETSSGLGTQAARRALEDAELDPADVEAIVVATSTPDMVFPSTSCLIQEQLGALNAFCLDISAACSGFLYAMDLAQQYIQMGRVRVALVIGTEKMSSITDWKDRATCILFGDAAGAAVLKAEEHQKRGLLGTSLKSDGSLGELLTVPAGGSRYPATQGTVKQRMHYIKMNGKEVYKHAVTRMVEVSQEVLARCNVEVEDVSCIIPHQANIRIILAVAQRLGVPPEKFFVNVEKYGNTSAASVGVALDEAARTGRIKRGQWVLIVVFGAGFTWGASLLKW